MSVNWNSPRYVETNGIRMAMYEQGAGVPVVMHSSLSSEANRAMGRSVGVDAYVAKFNATVLADTLRPYAGKSPAAGAA